MTQQHIEDLARKIRANAPAIGWLTAWNMAIRMINAAK
ncbi:hypothetical protein GFS31_24230 [Leptolyngbya sp. BL0902]|nr:hypothetical protein GFS31_24230 [Leptolyngbya sp. BL0902]